METIDINVGAVRAFLKVSELTSFTEAAKQLGLSKSRVSLLVRELERHLGSTLLQRSTRTVQLTIDGAQFRRRAQRFVYEADAIASMFQSPSALRGRLRVDLPVRLARDRIIPRLPEFLAQHPQVDLHLSTTDRLVDVMREGFDCVVRVGFLSDSSLVVRRLGVLSMMNCASPSYLKARGVPKTLNDLDGHEVIHYSNALGADPPVFEYHDGKRYRDKPMRASVTVNNADAYEAACLAGLGITQAPRIGSVHHLAGGNLVEILPAFTGAPLPVSLVHGYTKAAPRRVRAFMQWLVRTLTPQLV